MKNSKPKILIVDDAESTRDLFRAILEKIYVIEDAASGIQALEMLEEFSPDLILLDQVMPQMDGLAVLEEIKNRGQAYYCIMISGEAKLDVAVKAIQRGALDFLTKPVDPAVMRFAIEKGLRQVALFKEKICIEKERELALEELRKYKGHVEELVDIRIKESENACFAAEKANKMKSEFLSNISHELRTPMHGILSFARLGVKRIHHETKDDFLLYFTQIENCGERLLVLLDDLLDLSRLESGKIIYRFQKVSITDLIRRVVFEQQALSTEKGIEINFVLPEFSGIAKVDKKTMSQVFSNLLANAIKFSEKGMLVNISLKLENDFIVVSVVDSGIGIPETEREEVFDQFIQSSKTKSGVGGTGLGLAISRRIVTDHKGRIWAEANPEGGTIFYVAIPCK